MAGDKKIDKSTVNRQSVLERLEKKEDFDEVMRKKRELNKKTEAADEPQYIQRKPKVDAKNYNPNRFQQEEMKWLEKKKTRDAQKALDKVQHDCPFKPKITNNPRAPTVISTASNLPIGERLYQQAIEKNKKQSLPPVQPAPNQRTPKSKTRSRLPTPVAGGVKDVSVSNSNVIKFEPDDAFRPNGSNPYSVAPVENPYLAMGSNQTGQPPSAFGRNPYNMVEDDRAQVRRSEAQMNEASEIKKRAEFGDSEIKVEETEGTERLELQPCVEDGGMSQGSQSRGSRQGRPLSSSSVDSSSESLGLQEEDKEPKTSTNSAWTEKEHFRRSTIKELFQSLYNENDKF